MSFKKIDNISFSNLVFNKIYIKITSEYSRNNIVDVDKLIKEYDHDINPILILVSLSVRSMMVIWAKYMPRWGFPEHGLNFESNWRRPLNKMKNLL